MNSASDTLISLLLSGLLVRTPALRAIRGSGMTKNIQTLNVGQEIASLAMLNSDPRMHNQLKDLYRRCRNEFQNNPEAMVELAAWKKRENDVDYNILYVTGT